MINRTRKKKYSLLNNVFCPTGKGGGQDDSCSPPPLHLAAASRGSPTAPSYKPGDKVRYLRYIKGGVNGESGFEEVEGTYIKTTKKAAWGQPGKGQILHVKNSEGEIDRVNPYLAVSGKNGETVGQLRGVMGYETGGPDKIFRRMTNNTYILNPFKSKAQIRACYAADDPNWDCEEWQSHTPKSLPERVKKRTKNSKMSVGNKSKSKKLIVPMGLAAHLSFQSEADKRFGKIRDALNKLVQDGVFPTQNVDDATSLMLKNFSTMDWETRLHLLSGKPTGNVFCPTGPGGGQDNSCGKGLGSGERKVLKMDVLDIYQETADHPEGRMNFDLRVVKNPSKDEIEELAQSMRRRGVLRGIVVKNDIYIWKDTGEDAGVHHQAVADHLKVDQDANLYITWDKDTEKIELMKYVDDPPSVEAWAKKNGFIYNAFCATGEGGGIDSSCSSSESHTGTWEHRKSQLLDMPTSRLAKIVAKQAGHREFEEQFLKLDRKVLLSLIELHEKNKYYPREMTKREYEKAAHTKNSLFGRILGRTTVAAATVASAGDNCGTGHGGFQPGNTCARKDRDGGPAKDGEHTAAKASTDTPEFKEWFGDSKVVDKDGDPKETASIDGIRKEGEGKPKVVYHGTPGGVFHEFKKDKIANPDQLHYGPGFYFTEDVKAAEEFARGGHSSAAQGTNPTVMQFYLRSEKPFDVDKHEIDPSKLHPEEAKNVRAALVQKAYLDGGRDEAMDTGRKFDRGEVKMKYRELTDSAGVGGLGVSKVKVQEYLQKEGYDSITTQAPDVGEKGKNRYWIVFEPTQVKSTSNKGKFSKTDPNVMNATNGILHWNVFCATGEGGGVDPSCSSSSSGTGSSGREKFDTVVSGLPEKWQKVVKDLRVSKIVEHGSQAELRTARLATGAPIPEGVNPHELDVHAFYDRHSGELHLHKDTPHDVIAHELGHVIDGPSRVISSDPMFQKAARAESKNLSSYATTSPDEAFAELLRVRYTEGEKIAAQKAPKMIKALKSLGYHW